jgi:hypothetical protein
VRARRTALFTLLGFVLSTLLAVAALEIALRLFYPQETLRPRWAYSPQYCFTVYPDVRMVHERPGRWRFVYTTNRDRYRGKIVPFPGDHYRVTVVVLGDSYSFGAGVQDDEVYSATLQAGLPESYQVVNLGIGGWGLTQEIRRYYDFGARYAPRFVILQFSANDPEDDLKCPVTQVIGGKFVFRDSHEEIYSIKEYLSKSILQKSQIYNLFRNRIYRLAAWRLVERERERLPSSTRGAAAPEEQIYANLLEAFARDLHKSEVQLLLISVNGQLEEFPAIASKVHGLEAAGFLRYFDAADWLRSMEDYASPEGHLWGARAHRILGKRLSEVIQSTPALETPHP